VKLGPVEINGRLHVGTPRVWVGTFECDGREPDLLGFGFLIDSDEDGDEPRVFFHVYWPWLRPRPHRVDLEWPPSRWHRDEFEWRAAA
jgi:hypothetical protein